MAEPGEIAAAPLITSFGVAYALWYMLDKYNI